MSLDEIPIPKKLKLKERYLSWENQYNKNIKNYINFEREFDLLSDENINFLMILEDEILYRLFIYLNNTFNILTYIEIRNETRISKEAFFTKINKVKDTYLFLEEIKDYVIGDSRENIDNILEYSKRFLSDMRTLKIADKCKEMVLSNGFMFNPEIEYKYELHKGKYKQFQGWRLEPKNIEDDYNSLKHSLKGSHTLSYDDVLRLTIKICIKYLQDYRKPKQVIILLNEIFKSSTKQLTGKEVNFKSLYQNNCKLRYYSIKITQPQIPDNVHAMYAPNIVLSIDIDKMNYKNVKQFIHILYGGNKTTTPQIQD
ncbi:MAG: hypothetical protein KAJ49_00645 [Arcobacteraceae bacterium]|nr:hypothetical protein [Arcobacteraceae bacterium]